MSWTAPTGPGTAGWLSIGVRIISCPVSCLLDVAWHPRFVDGVLGGSVQPRDREKPSVRNNFEPVRIMMMNEGGLDLLLLHHVGRRTGEPYVTPLSYMAHGGSFLLVRSHQGSPVEPQWVANVEAASKLTVEVDARILEVTTTVLRNGPRRDEFYALQLKYWPFLRGYETRTTRSFPVIQLTPID
jgi:deazaflavin-dependent oxidoreductase (nitroreductase family)